VILRRIDYKHQQLWILRKIHGPRKIILRVDVPGHRSPILKKRNEGEGGGEEKETLTENPPAPTDVTTDATIVQEPREINTKIRTNIADGHAVPKRILADEMRIASLNTGGEIDLGTEGARGKMTTNHQEMRKKL
jgi:hypothetical protein